MRLTLETDNTDDIIRILAALTGGTTPAPVAAPKPKADKKEAPAPEREPAATTAAPVQAGATTSAETVTASPSDVVPDEAALTAAANSAIAKLGPGAQGKIKEYIAGNFQKDDGTAAGLRTVRVDQRARLLADLTAFADGKKVI